MVFYAQTKYGEQGFQLPKATGIGFQDRHHRPLDHPSRQAKV